MIQYSNTRCRNFYPRPPGGGRPTRRPRQPQRSNFYPRPPGGGRPDRAARTVTASEFLSTPSGWRATCGASRRGRNQQHFYPRPPGGGRPRPDKPDRAARTDFYPRPPGGGRPYLDSQMNPQANFYPRPPGGGRLSTRSFLLCRRKFLSTPSGWRATAKTDKVFVCFCAKGRRICLFKTREEKICRWRFKKDKFWVLIWCEGSGKSVCASASHCG